MSMTHDEMIAVIQASADGKEIEMSEFDTNNWRDIGCPRFNFGYLDYRIKPEPRIPREIWLNEYHGIVFGSAIHSSEKLAKLSAALDGTRQLRFREVIEEDGK